jgi:membrane protein YdbS with pleckstrin-like domain
MYCYRCGNKLPEASLYCNRCGTRVRPRRDQWQRDPDGLPSGRAGSGRSFSGDPLTPEAGESEATSSQRGYSNPKAPNSSPFIDRTRSSEWEESEEAWEEDWQDAAEAEEWDVDDGENDFDEESEDLEEETESLPPSTPRREQVIFSINPAFYPVTTGYLLSSFLAVVLTAGLAYFNVNLLFVLLSVAVAFVPAIVRHIQHIHTVFTLTTLKIEISTGLLSKKTQNIPLRHIQDVSVRESLSERLLGIGDIIIDTPAMESNTTLSNIREPRRYADQILAQIQRWNA